MYRALHIKADHHEHLRLHDLHQLEGIVEHVMVVFVLKLLGDEMSSAS